MELWIRSKDKTILMKSPELRYNKKGDDHSILAYDTMGVYKVLGTYSTKERCIEILDDIVSNMKKGAFARKINGFSEELDLIPNPLLIYNMPKE